jgi:hypothetical protein
MTVPNLPQETGAKGDDLRRPNWRVGFRNISRRAWHGRPTTSYHRERDIAATTLPLRRAAPVAGEKGARQDRGLQPQRPLGRRTVPLGYRCLDKKLEIEPDEAEAVRTIFT